MKFQRTISLKLEVELKQNLDEIKIFVCRTTLCLLASCTCDHEDHPIGKEATEGDDYYGGGKSDPLKGQIAGISGIILKVGFKKASIKKC